MQLATFSLSESPIIAPPSPFQGPNCGNIALVKLPQHYHFMEKSCRLRALGKVPGTARMLKNPLAASGTTQETPLYAASAGATGTVRSAGREDRRTSASSIHSESGRT